MTDAEKHIFLDGYRRALTDGLDDLVYIHQKCPKEASVRKVVDLVWERLKARLYKVKLGEFDFHA